MIHQEKGEGAGEMQQPGQRLRLDRDTQRKVQVVVVVVVEVVVVTVVVVVVVQVVAVAVVVVMCANVCNVCNLCNVCAMCVQRRERERQKDRGRIMLEMYITHFLVTTATTTTTTTTGTPPRWTIFSSVRPKQSHQSNMKWRQDCGYTNFKCTGYTTSFRWQHSTAFV